MDVLINGVPHQLPDQMSLDAAVSLISKSATGVAVALNGDVVRRGAWAQTPLSPGDQIEVLTAVQGG